MSDTIWWVNIYKNQHRRLLLFVAIGKKNAKNPILLFALAGEKYTQNTITERTTTESNKKNY